MPLVKQVCAEFEKKFAAFRYIEQTPHGCVGNPRNFLSLYKAAYETDARYVYLVEDDVHVHPDFFRWHEAVQARGNYFVTVGWHCTRNRSFKLSEDPRDYIESTCDYTSVGVCWKRENLASVVKHAADAYYSDMSKYLGGWFPSSPIPRGTWTEQAGLIMRIVLDAAGTKTVAFASRRRADHRGIHGYHRHAGYRFHGSLSERIAAFRAALAEGRLNKLANDPFDDIDEPIPTLPWRAEDLRVVQQFKFDGRI